MSPVFGLADCNNFYASCQRVFDPSLEGRAVVCLSNNDGCVIARSSEAKELGIAMGEPAFRLRRLIGEHDVRVFSSNFPLYGDMSRRVMMTLEEFTPHIQVYSIDEAFLDLSGLETGGLEGTARRIAGEVRKRTGIPVSIGIAGTKTLAKIANRIAKKSPQMGGVLDLTPSLRQRLDALAATEVGDVWGIGGRHREMLKGNGIHTALDLHDAPAAWVRKRMSVTGARTQMELRGISCLDLDSRPAARKTALVSRSFGRPVESLDELREAVSTFAARGAEKLRRDGLLGGALSVFIHTNRHSNADPQYSNAATVGLPFATNHSGHITQAALRGLRRIFRQGYRYKKAGVLLLDLVASEDIQKDLFAPPMDGSMDGRLMEAFDGINRRFGRGAIRYGVTGSDCGGPRNWRMNQAHRSPRYTTNWDELPLVY